MLSSPPRNLTRAILWMALLALVLGVIGSQVRISKCTTDCCVVAVSSCCEADASHDTTTTSSLGSGTRCCGCCDHPVPQQRAAQDSSHDSAANEQRKHETPWPQGDARGTCPPGCQVVVSFDLELAPLDVPDAPTHLPALVFAPADSRCPPAIARAVVRQRPFDRGPPRVDRCTALRACTVLLI